MGIKNTKRATEIGAAASAAALLLSACGGSGGEVDNDTSGSPSDTSLVIAVQGEVTTYDPWSAQSGLNGSLLQLNALYDSLVHLDEDGNPTPWLATEWESEDPSHYTLKLRDDVTFDDGSPVDATAVVANVEYAQSAVTPGECNTYLDGVTATAIDDYTVGYELSTPSVGFMVDLGSCAGFVVNPVAFDNPESLQTTPDGSGPYTLASSVAGQEWKFAKKADYWSSDTYPFEDFTIQYFKDSSAQENAAKAGQVDLLQTVNAETDTSGFALIQTSTDFRGIMMGDVNGEVSGPLADPDVRHAMQMAIDRNALQEAIYPNSGVVGYSTPFTTDDAGYTDALTETFPYDPEGAKALLAEAGYPDGFAVKVMTVDAIYGPAAQVVAGQLAEIGVTLELSDQSADFFNQLTSKSWAMYTFNWSIGTNRIHTYEGLVNPQGFWNIFGSESDSVDALLTELGTESDEVDQDATLEKIASAFQDDSWYLAPVLVNANSAYNGEKLSVTTTTGAPLPFLYQIQAVK